MRKMGGMVWRLEVVVVIVVMEASEKLVRKRQEEMTELH